MMNDASRQLRIGLMHDIIFDAQGDTSRQSYFAFADIDIILTAWRHERYIQAQALAAMAAALLRRCKAR